MMDIRYIGIDYSGAGSPDSGLKGLRVYMAVGDSTPTEILPVSGQSKYWTRRGVSDWLTEQLMAECPALVGIDHGFSFPIRYFEQHGLEHDWSKFLQDFKDHWPTDQPGVRVESVRNGTIETGMLRAGDARWRRLTDVRARAKSVFHFDVPGSVAKSTHAGLPWLLRLRTQVPALHFWPFDGWHIPPGSSAIFEAYPALWSKDFPKLCRTQDQHDAYTIAAALRRADSDGSLQDLFHPRLSADEKTVARTEGWILGVL